MGLKGVKRTGTQGFQKVVFENVVDTLPGGQYLDWYKNGVKQTNTYEPTASFGNPTSDLVLGKIDTTDKGGIMYRWGVEDLNAAGRTLGELVQKDWEYCNGIGEYVGLPTKRPFIDTV
ncbi:MAG TPA: hypothetical protein H9825_01030 [Candidatus Sphingobacterium stercorigallinarum]|nr:hypothetical protein [Candidatus Sphingobacterium stercorigallinarum]